jgi:PTH1 family peptidyl-tRNA hydrolase
MVLDVLAKRTNATFKQHKAHALVAEGKLGVGFDAPKLVLAKSLGYMNTSGGPETIKIKFSGGHGGHNGLRDIISAVGNDYIRVRVGIGRPPGRMDAADYVLRDFNSTEREELPTTLELAADIVEAIATIGLSEAQQKYN